MVELRYEIIAEKKNKHGFIEIFKVRQKFMVKAWAQDRMQKLEMLNPDTEYSIKHVIKIY